IVEESNLAADSFSPQAANVRELRRAFDRATRLPRHLVEELARVTSLAQQEWASALEDSDFERFRPWLERQVALKQQEARCLDRGGTLYDALLDEYEPGLTAGQVTELFDDLRPNLVALAQTLTHAPRQPQVSILHREYAIDRQRVFGES